MFYCLNFLQSLLAPLISFRNIASQPFSRGCNCVSPSITKHGVKVMLLAAFQEHPFTFLGHLIDIGIVDNAACRICGLNNESPWDLLTICQNREKLCHHKRFHQISLGDSLKLQLIKFMIYNYGDLLNICPIQWRLCSLHSTPNSIKGWTLKYAKLFFLPCLTFN